MALSGPAPGAAGLGTSGPSDTPRSPPPASPVAVVWCRQVDNEAESPGYTTVPEEFPGWRETLDTIRIVGNLTINIADTHDYWDPDPAQPLSYYPNLFLYPANGGRYTCVGRMFLSTEDRPRLGMKTVVLDTAQLLASHEFGATVVRWHASMGGARPGARLPPVPDAALYPIVGEGFLFQRGTTDPVLLIASEQWESATQAVLDLVRLMPASLVAPAAFLVFPYFLPAAKTDLKELTESLPLSLAIMRVARGEAAGDRHAKRVAAWESVCTVRDLTDGIPAGAPRGKEPVPLILQYAREHDEAKLRPIAQRVDLVEVPKLRQRLADPERAGGKDRRREMWRVGTAMESAALLLSKARGRHVPVSVETAKRAQEYLDARLPSTSEEAPSAPPEPATVLPEGALPTAQHPPWLQRNDAVAPIRVDRVEVVPVSHSDDPSLLPPAPKPPEGAVGPVESPVPPTSEGSPSGSFRIPVAPAPVDVVALKAELERNVARWVESRLAQFAPPLPPPSVLDEEIDRRASRLLEERLRAIPPSVSPAALAEAEARLSHALDERLAAAPAPPTRADLDALEARLRTVIAERPTPGPSGPSEADLAALERRLREAFDARLAALPPAVRPSELADASASLRTLLDERLSGLPQAVRPNDLTALETRLQALIERRLAGLPSPPTAAETGALVAPLLAPLLERLTALERRPSEAPDATARLAERITAEVARQVDALGRDRFADIQRRLDESARTVAEATLARQLEQIGRATERMRLEISAAEEDLRQGVKAQVELHGREVAERSAADAARLESRLADTIDRRLAEIEAARAARAREEEAALVQRLDARWKELEGQLPSALTASGGRVQSYLDARASDLETRLAARQEQQLTDLKETNASAAAELQVRLQAYFDQRLRESADGQQQTYVELLARMKSEIDNGLARVAETLPIQQAIRAQYAKLSEAERGERERITDERIRQSETRLRNDFLAAVHRLESLEQTLEDRGRELREVEASVRGDVAELDRRTAILSERLVPVIRKTWTRLEELEKGGHGPDLTASLTQVRRELQREMHRLETELVARESALRDRMETAITNQGRVWLTLIRQLSDLRANRVPELPTFEEGAADEVEDERGVAPARAEDPDSLDDLPELLKNRHRGYAPPAEVDLEEEPAPRRRRTRSPSRAG